MQTSPYKILLSNFQGCKWSLQQLRRYLVAKHGIEKVKIAHIDL